MFYKLIVIYKYKEQTNAHLIDSFYYTVLYLSLLHVSTPTLHPRGALTRCLVPAKLHKHVHAVLVVFFSIRF